MENDDLDLENEDNEDNTDENPKNAIKEYIL